MPVLNSMLNIMPYNCRYCVQGYYGMRHISAEARGGGLNLIEVEKEQANRGPVYDAIAQFDPIFVNHFGHGNDNITTGDSETEIWSSERCSNLANRVCYFLSCLCANGLGPAIIRNGGIAWAGFNISWTWMANSTEVDPYTDFYAEGFYRASNEFPIALIQGWSMEGARQRSVAEYDRWINIWETERAGQGAAASAIKWLIVDRDGLMLLGDPNAVIVATGPKSRIEFIVSPPSYTHKDEPFTVRGRLVADETGEPLLGRTINIREVGATEPISTTITDDQGMWSFGIALSKGFHRIFVAFLGDVEYTPFYSNVFSIGVGVTEMVVTAFPPESAGKGQQLILSGVLMDKATDLGILNKIIEISGSVNRGVITGINGNWVCNFAFATDGRYVVGARFAGDSDFMESVVPSYNIAVGTLPWFGYDGEVSAVRGARDRIIGSRFQAPANCTPVAILIRVYADVGEKMKAAIVRCSDRKLIGASREVVFSEYLHRILVPFVLVDPMPIVAGEWYWLLGWSNMTAMEYQNIGDDTIGAETTKTYGPDFPDPHVIGRTRDTLFNIICEYRKEEEQMAIHKRGTAPWTFTVIVPEEEHAVAVQMVGKFDTASPGETKQVKVGVICAVNGQACDLTSKAVNILDQDGVVVGQGTIEGWNATYGCYVSFPISVTVPTPPVTTAYTWQGEFPRQ